MVYMGGKGKNNASRSNQTSHFGIMGGLAPTTNISAGVRMFRLKRARNFQHIPADAIAGYYYMLDHDLLSRNPAGSGGVGRTSVLVHRSIGPCNCIADPARGAPDVDCVTEQDLEDAEKLLKTEFDKTSQAISDLDCGAADCATGQDLADAETLLQTEFDKASAAVSGQGCDADCATDSDIADAKLKLNAKFDEAVTAVNGLNTCGTHCPSGMHYMPSHAKAAKSGMLKGCMLNSDMGGAY